ncbi:MAG: response regulator [Magnetococcales bacterium]|nr:response regulator [Magnetococcales bacterium]
MKLSLPIKFGLLSLVVSMCGVFGVSLLAFNSSDDLLQKQALARLGDELVREKAVLHNKITTVVKDVRNLAKSDAVAGIIRANQNEGYDEEQNMTSKLWQNRLARRFSTIMEQRPEYVKIRLIGKHNQGMELVRVDRLDSTLKTIPQTDLQQKEQRNYFIESIKLNSDQIYFSRVTLNRENGRISFPTKTVLRIAIPIEDNIKEKFGIIIISVDFEQLSHSLLTPPPNIYYFLANSQGDYLIHPDEKKRLAFEFNKKAQIDDDFATYSQWANSKDHEINDYRRIFPSKELGTAIAHFHFTDWGNPERYLVLGAVAKLSELQKSSDILRKRLLVLIAFSVLFLTTLTIYVAKKLTSPIRVLTKVADQVTAGNESVDIPLIGNDEITTLGKSLKTMLNRLARSRQELAALNLSLEDKINIRTAELNTAKNNLQIQNVALSEALELAEESARSKSEFLATMSHEIRTPMNGVLGMAEMLLTTSLNTQQKRYTDVIYRSGESLLHIINDILDLSKIEAGRLELVEKPFDLRDMIEGVLDAFFVESGKKQLDLALRFRPVDMPLGIIGDISRLRQVLVNLIGNAIKFTSQGSVMVNVIEQNQTEDKLNIRIEVTDTGAGIPREIQEGLFEPFVQGDSSTSRNFGGTGLGLAIVKRLVDLLGGKLGLQSSPGEGSTFWFEITFMRDDKAIISTETYTKADQNKKKLTQTRLLIVDDNAINREIAREYIHLWGLECDEAEDAIIALEMLKKAAINNNQFDLILMDHMMPGMSGVELAENMATIENLAKIPVILLSSVADHEEPILNNTNNLKILLRKPVRRSILYNSIFDVLHNVELPEENFKAKNTSIITKTFDAPSKPCKLLIVEDSDINAEVAIEMLNVLGYRADWAKNGEEALEKMQSKDYDLAFMDCHMPGLDGYETTTRIREKELAEGGSVHLPIIALTAKAMEDDKNHCLSIGMDDYLAKPIQASDLQLMIEKWCDQTIKTNNEHPAFDRDALYNYKEQVGPRSGKIINRFIKRLPAQLQKIEAGINDNNVIEIGQAAHKLKGMARQFGALRLGDLSDQLEQNLKENSQSQLANLLNEMKEESVNVINELKKAIDTK